MQRRRHLSAVLLLVLAFLGAYLPVDQAVASAKPSVTAVSPDSGPLTGGTRVTIKGHNFTSKPVVKFGKKKATKVTVVSKKKLVVTAPALKAGAPAQTVDVRVTTPEGTSKKSKAARFSYLAVPALTTISPTSGAVVGGNTLTLTGSDLTGTRYVTVDAARLTPTSQSATQVTVTLPAHAAGPVPVSVTTAGGQSGAKTYTYIGPPVISGLSPAHGSMRGGTVVTISGSGFSNASAVTFDGTAAAGFTVNSDTSITATTPSRTTTGAVHTQVVVPAGSSANGASDQFTYGIIDFTIPAGTGGGSWNTVDNPVRGWVGDTVRFVNADSDFHRLHTAGSPGVHWPDPGLKPGGTLDWPLTGTCAIDAGLYDHNHNTDALFYIVVAPVGG
jgi:hypothetical protein